MNSELAMRRSACLVVVLGALLSAALTPAAAQPVLYEDWAAERIDPARWRPLAVPKTAYEVVRSIIDGRLHQQMRVYGGTEDDVGTQLAYTALAFEEGGLTAVQWDTAVHHYLLQGCPTPGAQPSTFLVDMRLPLFNDGSSQGPGDITGQVETRVRLLRRSDSVDPPEVVQAIGLVTRCNVPDCSTHDVLGEVSLGPVLLGQVDTFLMFWDAFRGVIEFRRNADPSVQVAYGVPVVTTLSGGRIWLVEGTAANCTVDPRPYVEGAASIDNIFVFVP